jgi:serine/threonine-protein kinase
MSAAHVLLLLLIGGEPAAGASFATLLGALLGVAAVILHLVFLVPRLGPAGAVGASLAIALVLFLASGALLAFGLFPLPVLPAWAALLAGHLGLRAGRSSQAPAVLMPAAPAAKPSPKPKELSVFEKAMAEQAAAPVGTRPDRTTLGRYRIDRQLGGGAMGAVYLGHDPKIGRQVAIKTMALAQEFEADELPEVRNRFFREAETAGRLRHPDIVTIFDAGEDQGLAYIAMEFVAGHDLQRHTRLGSLLPVPQVLRVVARVADALAYAHSQGVVHRDIKPANVMIDTDEPRGENVKVTDFGIARVADASRTRTGMVLGTPSFMSPEQMAGRRVDGRSDLYSLGVMLYQLLSGRLPHQADSMAQLMSKIANERAPDVRALRPELPEALGDIVALALQKQPEVRYADGRQMATDLRAVEAMYGPDAGGPVPPRAEGDPPDSDAFAATVRFSRDDPRHNSPR